MILTLNDSPASSSSCYYLLVDSTLIRYLACNRGKEINNDEEDWKEGWGSESEPNRGDGESSSVESSLSLRRPYFIVLHGSIQQIPETSVAVWGL